MEDCTVKKPMGISFDIIVKVNNFIFLADFVVLDCEVNFEMCITLGRPFLATARALTYMGKRELKFKFNNDEVIFNVSRTMKKLT